MNKITSFGEMNKNDFLLIKLLIKINHYVESSKYFYIYC